MPDVVTLNTDDAYAEDLATAFRQILESMATIRIVYGPLILSTGGEETIVHFASVFAVKTNPGALRDRLIKVVNGTATLAELLELCGNIEAKPGLTGTSP
jgi:hypothetical protein